MAQAVYRSLGSCSARATGPQTDLGSVGLIQSKAYKNPGGHLCPVEFPKAEFTEEEDKKSPKGTGPYGHFQPRAVPAEPLRPCRVEEEDLGPNTRYSTTVVS